MRDERSDEGSNEISNERSEWRKWVALMGQGYDARDAASPISKTHISLQGSPEQNTQTLGLHDALGTNYSRKRSVKEGQVEVGVGYQLGGMRQNVG